MPAQQSLKVELVINLETAQALCLTVPLSLTLGICQVQLPILNATMVSAVLFLERRAPVCRRRRILFAAVH